MPLSFPASNGPTLDKDALVKSGEAFYITEPPSLVDTSYGPRVRVAARTASGEAGTLMFGSTTVLGSQLVEVAALMVASPGEEVGPLSLHLVPLAGGKSTYAIENVEPAPPAGKGRK